MQTCVRKTFCSLNGIRIVTARGNVIIACVGVACLLIPFFTVLNRCIYQRSYHGFKRPEDNYIAGWNDEDPRLIDHIRAHYLTPPADRSEPYRLAEPNRLYYSQDNQDVLVSELFKWKRNGFFVEAGAYDGEALSNTLYFERMLNWTGLLVEPDYANLQQMLQKRRKSWVLNGCLEGSRHPKKLRLYGAMDVGVLGEHLSTVRWFFMNFWRPVHLTEVWCFPLAAVMRAINRTQIDYFALDIEGAELAVLKSIPFDELDIRLMQIEYTVFNGAFWSNTESKRRLDQMKKFFETNLPQYEQYRCTNLDIFFIKKNMSNAT